MNFDRVRVVRGSLLDIEANAIVNAANTLMRGGGGIERFISEPGKRCCGNFNGLR